MARYRYDWQGNRVQQTANTVDHRYLWDEFTQYGDVVLETDEMNAVAHAYTLGMGMILAQDTYNGGSHTTHFFLADAQGSTRALTNAAGTVEAEFFYDAFGELQTAAGNLASEQNLLTDYLYTGQQYDADLDLYSLRARYYDTAQGRFLSRDTYPYNYQNPFELNRYVYTANNPTTYVDPSGYAAMLDYFGINNSTGNKIADYVLVGGHGAFFGTIEGIFTYIPAVFGMCGPDAQAAALEMGYVKYLAEAAAWGAHTSLSVAAIVNLGGPHGEDIANLFIYSQMLVGFVGAMNGDACATIGMLLDPFYGPGGGSGPSRPPTRPIPPVDPSAPSKPPTQGGGSGNGGTTSPIDGTRPGGCNSFSADTPVVTPDGEVDISLIDIGDTVYAYDELTGEVGEYTVTATISHVDEDIVHLTIDGELIETTAEHPFYTDDAIWVDAADLEVGEQILSLDGDYGAVEAVEIAEDVYQPMYNLTVDEAHTFAVGDGAWVVHNQQPNCFFYLTGNYTELNTPKGSLNREINATGDFTAIAAYDEGKLVQIRLYDDKGRGIYDIDSPEIGTVYEFWHLHDYSHDPGNPSAGRGSAEKHQPLGGKDGEGKAAGTEDDLIRFLESIGIFNVRLER